MSPGHLIAVKPGANRRLLQRASYDTCDSLLIRKSSIGVLSHCYKWFLLQTFDI